MLSGSVGDVCTVVGKSMGFWVTGRGFGYGRKV